MLSEKSKLKFNMCITIFFIGKNEKNPGIAVHPCLCLFMSIETMWKDYVAYLMDLGLKMGE